MLIVQAGSPSAAKEPTETPYGKAMHLRQASYCVWPLWLHVLLSTLVVAVKAVFWICPLLAVLYITVGGIEQSGERLDADAVTLGLMCAVAIGIYPLAAVIALAIEAGAK